MPTTERYVPAVGRAWLTALYDPVMALTMRERAFRPALIAAVLADPLPRLVLDNRLLAPVLTQTYLRVARNTESRYND